MTKITVMIFRSFVQSWQTYLGKDLLAKNLGTKIPQTCLVDFGCVCMRKLQLLVSVWVAAAACLLKLVAQFNTLDSVSG